jgi:hypothetical protein
VLWDYWLHFLRPESGSLVREVDGLFNQMIGRPNLAALRRKVKGRVVVVTGASSGIGASVPCAWPAPGPRYCWWHARWRSSTRP